MSIKKKIFPKLKKKLKSFLTDESWKITKKDALGLAVGAVLLSSVDEVLSSHSNYCTTSRLASPSYPVAHNNSIVNNWSWTSKRDVVCAHKWSISASHSSWLVNWHYSASPTVIWTASLWHSSHGSHWSHWSHGSY